MLSTTKDKVSVIKLYKTMFGSIRTANDRGVMRMLWRGYLDLLLKDNSLSNSSYYLLLTLTEHRFSLDTAENILDSLERRKNHER